MENTSDGWKIHKPVKNKYQKQNENRMKKSYFTQQYNAYGENFTNFKTSRDIEFESKKIFRDLAGGLIDLEKHGKAFEDVEFVGVLVNVAYKQLIYHDATRIGLESYIYVSQMNGIQLDNYIYQVCGEHSRSTVAYNMLYQALLNIQINHDYMAILPTLMPMLNAYRDAL